ncbi:hypothetical protein RRG08_035741, partial [Elysia crispata]
SFTTGQTGPEPERMTSHCPAEGAGKAL